MVTTDNEQLWKRVWSYKDHGKSYDAVFRREHPPGFRWLHEGFGTNGRMTEMQAAIGRVVLPKLPRWLAKRRRFADILSERFAEILRPPRDIAAQRHRARLLQILRVRETLAVCETGWDRDRVMNAVTELGIPCYSGSCSEIYLEKAFGEGWPPSGRDASRSPRS